ncbi:protein kinase domain-containing protein [Nostoc sp. 'Peltigera malacea cyanobiont' DB3992]|uniref:protein kinase domain-containing protein n=1 Tax=Nostoc sp. 'Peltigera malacea cyanobiont' DB3992 TaxID=1206980 RepID=UPI000C0459A7|nr:protein kinase [Nostoc sp. 'Peltigera malacea cyanobiont' DB3992]PHM11660.1 serine/threonine protein kinase [Nostoc sp. 'Peltigera malacea cyanobiont' DB3992]
MPAKIILTVIQGQLLGQQYIFDCRTSCIIGRSPDCNPQLPDDENHRGISRYHCLLDINPPDIRVRDFGSKNGTYINGKNIGQRQRNQTAEEAVKFNFPEYDLRTGDEINLGHTIFKVSIEIYQDKVNLPTFIPDDVTVKNNPVQQAYFLDIIKYFLNLAESGDRNLKAISGYNLVKLLSTSEFGEVYLAQHNQSGKFIALKVMLPAVAANDFAVQMFLRETENTKALQHPHVVQLMDCGFSEIIFFFTMEYCEGGTVWDFMQQLGGRLSVEIAVPIILQILDALEYAHNVELPYVKLADGKFGKGKGIVHRDLKPSNIFLTNIDGKLVAKIGNYGLSKAFDLAGLSGQTLTGTQAGTPLFMPRQQVLNFKYAQPEVDIWAVAACLYNMLTGCFPRNFTGDPFLAVLQNNPIPIRQRDATIMQPLAQVIDLALVDKPEIHFKSAAEFKRALLSALSW